MSDVKILAVGDTHFKVSNLPESREMASRILKVAQASRPDAIVLLGDIHDDFERIHSSVLTAIQDMVRDLSRDFPVYMLIGNHDLINNSVFLEPKHPFNALKEWRNVTVVDKVITRNIGGDQHGQLFTFLPYVPAGRFAEALATCESWKSSRAIFCHQEFKRAKLGAIASEHGDDWPEGNNLVISGHIHDYDRLQSNILYVGTPMAHSFGDTATKTISLFTFKSDGEFEERRIDLKMPKRLTFELSIEEAMKFEVPENSIVRIYLKDTSGALAAFKKTKDYKELEKKAKVIPKASDISEKIVSKGRTNYIDILKQEAEKSGPKILNALKKVLSNEDKP